MKSSIKLVLAVGAIICAIGGAASAASVNWFAYQNNDIDKGNARADRSVIDFGAQLGLETFEGDAFIPVPDAGGPGTSTLGGLSTNVGTFTTTAGTRCGGSCDAPFNESLIRNESRYGRYNMTDPGEKWLDSNDNEAVNLEVAGIGFFNRISLYLTDIDDVGPRTFSIYVDGVETDISAQYATDTRRRNGELFLVYIDFASPTDTTSLSFMIDDGDGFGIDDVRVGLVPIPGSFPLLAAGVGLLAWRARRQRG